MLRALIEATEQGLHMEPYDLKRHDEDGFIYLWVADPDNLTGVRKVAYRYPRRKPEKIQYVVSGQAERNWSFALFAFLVVLGYLLVAMLLHAV